MRTREGIFGVDPSDFFPRPQYNYIFINLFQSLLTGLRMNFLQLQIKWHSRGFNLFLNTFNLRGTSNQICVFGLNTCFMTN